MGLLLAVHLGTVMAFFLTMPYGKFAHGVFRSASLLKNAVDKRMDAAATAASAAH
jgi:citrate/tricarballylate utilization protein